MKYVILLLAISGVFASGCDVQDEQRCEELDQILVAKGQQLPRSCEADVDCLLVDIHAGLTVGANAPASDPEIDRIKARRVELCADFEDDFVAYEARCIQDVCTAQVIGTVDPPPDAGVPDADPPDEDVPQMCDCADSPCGFAQVCVDGCVCEPLCEQACANADACDKLEELRLGSDIANCELRCEAFVEREGQTGVDLLSCLLDPVCDNLSNCL